MTRALLHWLLIRLHLWLLRRRLHRLERRLALTPDRMTR